MSGTLFIVSAPSGAGKTSLVQAVISDLKTEMQIERVITYTTKKPRICERDGRDYHFASVEQFEQLLEQDFFMEHSRAYTDYYGSPRTILKGLAQGKSYILILDRVGAHKVIKTIPGVVSIWIEAPSVDELRCRLVQRGTDCLATIERRISRAQIEMKQEKSDPFYEYHLVNNDFAQARVLFRSIIVQKISQNGLKKA